MLSLFLHVVPKFYWPQILILALPVLTNNIMLQWLCILQYSGMCVPVGRAAIVTWGQSKMVTNKTSHCLWVFTVIWGVPCGKMVHCSTLNDPTSTWAPLESFSRAPHADRNGLPLPGLFWMWSNTGFDWLTIISFYCVNTNNHSVHYLPAKATELAPLTWSPVAKVIWKCEKGAIPQLAVTNYM